MNKKILKNTETSIVSLLNETKGKKLHELNKFLIPVLTGMSKEMGTQYRTLMVEYRQKAYDILITPESAKRMITDADAKEWIGQWIYDIKRREIWLRVPEPKYFADWIHFDRDELWV